MSSKLIKSLSFAPLSFASLSFSVGAALIGSVARSQSSFAMTSLASGYMLADAAATAPMAKPMAKHMEGKCGEGLCGMSMVADTDHDGTVSAAEHAAHAKMMFEMADTNHDGLLSKDEMAAMRKSMHEGKCGEGKCGAEMMGNKGMTHHEGKMKHGDKAEDAAEHSAMPAKK